MRRKGRRNCPPMSRAPAPQGGEGRDMGGQRLESLPPGPAILALAVASLADVPASDVELLTRRLREPER